MVLVARTLTIYVSSGGNGLVEVAQHTGRAHCGSPDGLQAWVKRGQIDTVVASDNVTVNAC